MAKEAAISVARKAVRGISKGQAILNMWVTPDLDKKRVMALIAKLPKSLNLDLSDVVMCLDEANLSGDEVGMILTDTHLYSRSFLGSRGLFCGFPKTIITRLSDLQDVSVDGIASDIVKITTPTGTNKISMVRSDRAKIICEVLQKCIPLSG